VGVKVDHHAVDQRLIVLQGADRDRDIVEDAEPFSPVGEGMVRATGQIGGDPIDQRRPRRRQRAGGRDVAADRQFGRPRQPQPASRYVVVLSRADRPHVVRRVHAQEVGVGDDAGIEGARDDAVRDQPGRRIGKLAHREHMPRRQRREVPR